MKVVTIGRSSENTVCINDPFVGRHHCQIIQYDDGTYSVIDMRSTNGTYVNGGRIYGEARLQPNDTVTIGRTSLPWMSYFNPVPQPSKTNSKTLPVVLGSIGGALVVVAAFIIALLYGKAGDLGDDVVLYNGPEPPETVVTLEEDGEYYDVYAAEGQIIVMFQETVTHKEAVKILKKNKAKIIAQIPNVHYYLVEVPSGKEGMLVSYMRHVPEIDFVYPNAIEDVLSAVPYALDEIYGDHGRRVVGMLEERGYSATKHNIASEGAVSLNKVFEFTENILENLGKDEGAVINMSFGPSLIRLFGLWPWQKRVMWNERLVTEGNKLSFKKRYIKDLRNIITFAKRYDEKDFVIFKSSGNEGMKELEVIIDELKNELTPEEIGVFERHFILVSAKDDNKEGDYPNDVKTYSKMVTKVDISDKTAQDLHWQGTSFASPRAAGIITAVANKYDKKVVDVLEYARKATLLHPEHLLTMEDLSKLIAEDNPSISNEGSQGNNPSTGAGTKQGIPANLVGTKWTKTEFGEECTLEFVNKNQVKIKTQDSFYLSKETRNSCIGVYNCYYDSEIDRIVVVNPPFIWKRLKYENGRLFETDYYFIVEYDRI